jgi:DNA polymerase I
MANQVLYLIDGHAVAYRQYFALDAAGFSTKAGEPTNAVFGFTRTLLDILEHEKPKYLAVAFDQGLSGRDEVYGEYKATRDKMPDELDVQIKRLYQLVKAFSIPTLVLAGYEADDVIGTISRQAQQQNLDVHIITGDKDLLQLLTPNVRIQLPKRGKRDVVYDLKLFEDEYGLTPQQFIDLKGLMGDTSDNIPGIKGIGAKTGTKLLQQFDTLEGIYENLDSLKGKQLERLQEGRELAFMSRELARIRTDLPLKLDVKQCVAQDYDAGEVAELFRELEFRSFLDRLRNHDMRQLPLFGGADGVDIEGSEPLEGDTFPTTIVQDKDALDALVAVLNNAKAIAFDTETTSTDVMSARLVGISLAIDDESGYYIPVGHDDGLGMQIALDFVLDALRGPLTDPNILKYAHNATYDLLMLQRYGIDVQPITFDTMLAEWIRDPNSKFLSLKNFARQYLEIDMVEIDQLIGKGKNQKSMATIEIERVAPYAGSDAVVTLKAVDFLSKEIAEDGNQAIFERLEMPIVPVIAAMERAGIVLDVGHLRQMSDELANRLAALEDDIADHAGRRFNINSPKQLNNVLFDQLKLPVEGLKKTLHGYSTDATTLEVLRDQHPIIARILDYRELAKLKSTYVDALPELINDETGRVHTSYNQTGTNTGRFSSSNPNLQNIPIRTELGREVRRAIVAPRGHVLLGVDYSQIELRVMAHISQDETLIAAFKRGEDIHRATAAAVYRINAEDVTYEQRSFAKRVNFGLMYGMGYFRLARDSDLTQSEARKFIETYFEQLPGVKKYIDETQAFASEHHYTKTLMDRKRTYPVLMNKGDHQAVQSALRAAINMPIQGTAADILKVAMINLYKRLGQGGYKARMVLQVHDELVLEVPENELAAVSKLVVETMESAFELVVPLVANAEYGPNWRDMEPVE